jgi:hypothetical protein
VPSYSKVDAWAPGVSDLAEDDLSQVLEQVRFLEA